MYNSIMNWYCIYSNITDYKVYICTEMRSNNNEEVNEK